MRLARLLQGWRRARISARARWLDLLIWSTAAVLGAVAALGNVHRFMAAAVTTGWVFLTLALVVAGGLAADRVGVFRLLARTLIPDRASGRVVAGAVLAYTALLSGLINLDVAVIVAVPVAVRVARRSGLLATRMAIATALTANATSFLLPSSNLTTLLVLGRAPLTLGDFVAHSWIAWLFVTAATVCGLAVVMGCSHSDHVDLTPARSARSEQHTLLGLLPMYVDAAAIRALLGTAAIQLGPGYVRAAAASGLLAATVNNLPAAAAVAPAGGAALWAMVLALAIGPNLIVTGSVATLIARQLARTHMVDFPIRTFSLLGAILIPAQMLLAFIGLHIAGAV